MNPKYVHSIDFFDSALRLHLLSTVQWRLALDFACVHVATLLERVGNAATRGVRREENESGTGRVYARVWAS